MIHFSFNCSLSLSICISLMNFDAAVQWYFAKRMKSNITHYIKHFQICRDSISCSGQIFMSNDNISSFKRSQIRIFEIAMTDNWCLGSIFYWLKANSIYNYWHDNKSIIWYINCVSLKRNKNNSSISLNTSPS